MNTYGVQFDYGSVMFYPKNASSTNGGITISTTDPLAQDTIGKALAPSKLDWHKLCSLYNCKQCAGQPFKRTTNGDCPKEMKPREDPYCSFLSPSKDYTKWEDTCCQKKERPKEPPPLSPTDCSKCEISTDRNVCNATHIQRHPTYWNSYCCGESLGKIPISVITTSKSKSEPTSPFRALWATVARKLLQFSR